MEAGGTAHYWGRRCQARGLRVQLLSPQCGMSEAQSWSIVAPGHHAASAVWCMRCQPARRRRGFGRRSASCIAASPAAR